VISFTILGQPCSKANRRRIVTLNRGEEDERAAVVKSKEALAYERDALRQIPAAARQRLEGPVAVTIRIWYASERPDLDESIILDCLQDRFHRINAKSPRVLLQAGVYRNDRQVREKHVFHAIDRANPRAEIAIQALTPQQPGLPLSDPEDLAPEIFG
jgi:Holliday junction resolvase RusA-like endonuclease